MMIFPLVFMATKPIEKPKLVIDQLRSNGMLAEVYSIAKGIDYEYSHLYGEVLAYYPLEEGSGRWSADATTLLAEAYIGGATWIQENPIWPGATIGPGLPGNRKKGRVITYELPYLELPPQNYSELHAY